MLYLTGGHLSFYPGGMDHGLEEEEEEDVGMKPHLSAWLDQRIRQVGEDRERRE